MEIANEVVLFLAVCVYLDGNGAWGYYRERGIEGWKHFEGVAHISFCLVRISCCDNVFACCLFMPLRSQLTEHEKEVTGLEVKLEKVGAVCVCERERCL